MRPQCMGLDYRSSGDALDRDAFSCGLRVPHIRISSQMIIEILAMKIYRVD